MLNRRDFAKLLSVSAAAVAVPASASPPAEQKLTLPVGVMATLDADAGLLTLNESAVV